MSKLSNNQPLGLSKMIPSSLKSSGEKVVGVTEVLAVKCGAETLEFELDILKETWKNFKYHLLESTPKNLATMVQSLFLIELQSHFLSSSFEIDLGVSTNELRNLDNLLARFEDYCIPRLLLKFQKFKSLFVQHEHTGSNLSHRQDSESSYIKHKVKVCKSDKAEGELVYCGSALKNIHDISEQKSACHLQMFNASDKIRKKTNSMFMACDKTVEKDEMTTAPTVLKCDDSWQSQSEQAVLVILPEASNMSSVMRKQNKCQEKETGNIKEFNCIGNKDNCNSAEIVSEKSLHYQPFVNINFNGTSETDLNSSHHSVESQVTLPQKRITRTDNHRPMRKVKEGFCPMCEFKCKNTRELKGHMKSHADKDQHKYSTCKNIIKQRISLNSCLEACKKNTTKKGGSYSSVILDSVSKQYLTPRHLRNEKLLKHSSTDCKQLSSCKICNRSLSVNTNGKAQRKNKQLKCEICQRTFQGLAKLKRHKLTHSGDKPYNCKLCGTTFADKSHLNVHLRKHSGEKPFKCDICESSFSESTKLKNHKRIHTGEKPFVCEICGSSFSVSSSLKSHMKIHSGERPYKCNVCDFTSAHSSNLKSHLVVHTGEKKFPCDECSASFTETAKLKRHKMVHTGEKPYSCEVCGARFADKSHLTVHLRIHSGEKPFKCTLCSSAFVESSKLKNHLRTHTGEKPYICEICGMSFAVSYSLKSHMRRHTGEKPYKCDICGYATSQSSNLKSHMVVHNGTRPHTCDVCGASFSEPSKLNRHRIIHLDQKEERSVNNLSLDQNSHESGQIYLENLHLNCEQKQNTNWQKVNCPDLNYVNTNFSSVSHKNSHTFKNNNHPVLECEAQYRNIVQPFQTSLTTPEGGSAEAGGSITGMMKLLQQSNIRMSDDTFHFASLYKGEHISDSTLHIDLQTW